MTPRDLRNIQTTGNSCRDALPYANIAPKLPPAFISLSQSQLIKQLSFKQPNMKRWGAKLVDLVKHLPHKVFRW